MQKPVILSLFIALFTMGLNAQVLPVPPAGRNAVSIVIGLNHSSIQDQNASPLIYVGRLPEVSIHYTRILSKGELRIGLKARYGSFDAKAYPNRAINRGEWMMPLAGKLIYGNFSLNYLRNLHTSTNGAIRLGIGIAQLLQYPTEAPNAGLISVTGLPALLEVQHRLGARNSFTSQLQYNLAGIVTRLPWHATISLPGVEGEVKALYKNNTRLEGGHRIQHVTWQTKWQHNLSKHFAFGLAYQLERLRYPAPRPLSSWANSLSASSSVSF